MNCIICNKYNNDNIRSVGNHRRWCSGKMKPRKLSLETRKKLSIMRMGEKNPAWAGNKVTYKGLHLWIRKQIPKPEYCVNCKINKPYDIANISQKYTRNTDDWKWLCRKCHIHGDGRLKNLKQYRNGDFSDHFYIDSERPRVEVEII